MALHRYKMKLPVFLSPILTNSCPPHAFSTHRIISYKVSFLRTLLDVGAFSKPTSSATKASTGHTLLAGGTTATPAKQSARITSAMGSSVATSTQRTAVAAHPKRVDAPRCAAYAIQHAPVAVRVSVAWHEITAAEASAW
ncbi:hypothetical protein BJV78DRAFT_1285254 [Lactifluus subvellereus]|nr:hypothetical protein BJV78DRAFT_1285254 [Lactifluus subvellereus]